MSDLTKYIAEIAEGWFIAPPVGGMTRCTKDRNQAWRRTWREWQAHLSEHDIEETVLIVVEPGAS